MDKVIKQAFYVGTSNIMLPVANKQSFPEEFRNTSRLTYYASIFNSLEINSSFYKIPLEKTVVRWMLEVPEEFRFTFKMNREITHNKTLVCNPPLIANFMRTINNAKHKKGALLIQFPAGILYNLVYLKQLLFFVQQNNEGWDVCVEFRYLSWYRDSTYHLLEAYRSGMVIHDMPGSAAPQEDTWTDFAYLRFHGPKGDYKEGYEPDVLEKYAGKIKSWLRDGKTVYTYFNNTIGSAVFDALALQKLITNTNGIASKFY